MNGQYLASYAPARLLPLRRRTVVNGSYAKRVRFSNSIDDEGAVTVQVIEIPRVALDGSDDSCLDVNVSDEEERTPRTEAKLAQIGPASRVARSTKLKLLNKDGPSKSASTSEGSAFLANDQSDLSDSREHSAVLPNAQRSYNARLARKLTDKLPPRPVRANVVTTAAPSQPARPLPLPDPPPQPRLEPAWFETEGDLRERSLTFSPSQRLPQPSDSHSNIPSSPTPSKSNSLVNNPHSKNANDYRLRSSDWLNANGLVTSRNSIQIRPLFS